MQKLFEFKLSLCFVATAQMLGKTTPEKTKEDLDALRSRFFWTTVDEIFKTERASFTLDLERLRELVVDLNRECTG